DEPVGGDEPHGHPDHHGEVAAGAGAGEAEVPRTALRAGGTAGAVPVVQDRGQAKRGGKRAAKRRTASACAPLHRAWAWAWASASSAAGRSSSSERLSARLARDKASGEASRSAAASAMARSSRASAGKTSIASPSDKASGARSSRAENTS